MIDLVQGLINFILHIDEHLVDILQRYGSWAYGIVFLIVFIETGVVIFPFLPGDSLLFASGAFAALGAFNLWVLLIVLFLAAVLGDSLNYEIGRKVGTAITPNGLLSRVINQERMDKAQRFFNKHGGKTVMIARFMPFIRTFIPFIAGASKMRYGYFLVYNVIGAALWVALCTFLGYLFGNIPIVKNNFSTVILLIIFVSLLPVIFGYIKTKVKK